MKKIAMILAGGIFAMLASATVTAQEPTEKQQPEGYKFTDVKRIETTSVKDQSRSGTCWAFSANSFIESELIRMGKGEHDLSEMWVARHTYMDKAEKYVRMQGTINFAAGGSFFDVFNVIEKYGAVTEEAYPGLGYGLDNHNHAELDAVLEAYVKAVVANKGKTLTSAWKAGFNGILDAYFGAVPENFTHNGKSFTPKSYAASLGLKLEDYVSLTSFTHHPFYTSFVLEIPDNWVWESSYNLPLNELMQVFDYSIDNGYTIAWGADVSEKGFAYMKGLAVVPEANVESMDGTEQAKWVAMSQREREASLYKFERPGKEKAITQEMRQAAFDNYETTDDHGMLINGTAKDQDGNKYFLVKNSWGETGPYKGYFYASYPFVEYKTMNIVVNRNAIPQAIRSKLGLK